MQHLQREVPDSLSALVLVALAAGCVWVVLFMPRPVAPNRPPPLLLNRQAILDVLERDRRLQEVPAIQGVIGQRARALLQIDAALGGHTEAKLAFAPFIRLLRHYGAVSGDRFVAPRFVVRTLYAAHWNRGHGMPPTEGFSQVEAQAYYGWVALRATDVPPGERAQALEVYVKAGGLWAHEVRGTLAWALDRPQDAVRYFEIAYQTRRSWRFRNHGIAARQAQLRGRDGSRAR